MQNKRQKAEKKGRFAERLAKLFLQLKGYRILEQRWKTKLGEVDLIAFKNNQFVFIEVKARKTHQLALEAVTHTNRRRIEAAAGAYLQYKKITPLPVLRYDIISVAGLRLQHRQNAWRSGD